MSYDIPNLHIADGSPEGRTIESIMSKEHLTSPAEAVLRALRQQAPNQTPIEETWGSFSSPEDSEIVDQAMKHVQTLRQTDRLRDFGT